MVYCYSCISTDFLVDHLLLGGQWRGFSLCSSISSSITRLGVIFVFASLFPTLFLLIVAVFMINYGLECFANLGIAYIYHSTHQLFEYKFWIVKVEWGSKQSQVFYTLSEFLIVLHCCLQCAYQGFDKMPLRHFLTCLGSDEYQTLGFLMFPHQEHVWFIGCVFNTPCPTCAFSMLWSCIAHSHPLHTSLLPLSCIGLYLISSSQHIMFTLCFVAFCFVFCLSFISHSSCTPHASLSLFIPSSLALNSPWPFVYSCQKVGRVYSRVVYWRVLSFLYDSCAHSQFYFLCTFVGGEIFHRGDAYTNGQRTLC